ncbi:hypothetical protein SAMN06297387_116141 [Streptomyces zhaozhouensis]|uniref:Uncharacterized protein n=1 Tax=Streptomyces zhaozhouensis TaxID=1300267 RepID=A0A286E0H9_9ACTN|nr:hypothetical protein [Streptomyces zhaozhouensis]SOD64417.1 hypothetical protein SAMN06297387_116141 [Streptomyces zhaozhouensis]
MPGEEEGVARDHGWWVARLDVDASAPRGYRVEYLPGGAHASRADAGKAAVAQAGEDGGPAPRAPGSVDVVGRAGTYWVTFDRRRSLSLELADADGDPVRLGVRLTPPGSPASASAPPGRHARRSAPDATREGLAPPDGDRHINRRKLPIPLQAEGGAITLCGSVGGLLALQGLLSTSHAGAAEAAGYSFVPAAVLLVAACLWHRNWYPRASRAYRERVRTGRR